MATAIAHLRSVSPFSWSAPIQSPRKDKESHDDHEQRTWRERCHADAEGQAFIPPMAFKNCIQEAAKYLGEKIPGKRNATWTKHFEAGVLVLDPLYIGVKRDAVPGERLFVPSDGKPGGGSRVWKTFPVVPSWEGDVTFHVLDDTITEAAFRHHLEEAGKFIGVGRFRPRNRGFYGRFEVVDMKWSK